MHKTKITTNAAPSHKLAKTMLFIAMPLFILALFVLSVQFCANDEAWLRREYDKLEINDFTGMTTKDQCAAFMRMVDFMSGRVDSMDIEVTVFGEKMLMYNESEISHMHDVRRLYSGVMVFKWAALAFSAVAVVYAVITLRKRSIVFISKAYLIAFGALLGLFVLIGAWALIDFYSFWNVFHIVFLDLESSTFDPMYSRMIQICPETLFRDMVIRIFCYGLVCAAVLGVGLGNGSAYMKKHEAKKLR